MSGCGVPAAHERGHQAARVRARHWRDRRTGVHVAHKGELNHLVPTSRTVVVVKDLEEYAGRQRKRGGPNGANHAWIRVNEPDGAQANRSVGDGQSLADVNTGAANGVAHPGLVWVLLSSAAEYATSTHGVIHLGQPAHLRRVGSHHHRCGTVGIGLEHGCALPIIIRGGSCSSRNIRAEESPWCLSNRTEVLEPYLK